MDVALAEVEACGHRGAPKRGGCEHAMRGAKFRWTLCGACCGRGVRGSVCMVGYAPLADWAWRRRSVEHDCCHLPSGSLTLYCTHLYSRYISSVLPAPSPPSLRKFSLPSQVHPPLASSPSPLHPPLSLSTFPSLSSHTLELLGSPTFSENKNRWTNSESNF